MSAIGWLSADDALQLLARHAWQSGAVVVVALALHVAFRRVASPRWLHAMWLLVMVRLMLAVSPVGAWSVFDAAYSRHAVTSDVPVAAAIGSSAFRSSRFAQCCCADWHVIAQGLHPTSAAPSPALGHWSGRHSLTARDRHAPPASLDRARSD